MAASTHSGPGVNYTDGAVRGFALRPWCGAWSACWSA